MSPYEENLKTKHVLFTIRNKILTKKGIIFCGFPNKEKLSIGANFGKKHKKEEVCTIARQPYYIIYIDFWGKNCENKRCHKNRHTPK